MNPGGKGRRRPLKVTRKVDRGGYNNNNKLLEGKSSITAKRLTLLPGFLVSGFSSKTVTRVPKKGIQQPSRNKQKEYLLNEDLHSFLQENNRHFRRSARILSKHLEEQANNNNNSPQENRQGEQSTINALTTTASSYYEQTINNNPKSNHTNNNSAIEARIEPNKNYKPILKNNSKSLFSEINKRYNSEAKNNNKIQILSDILLTTNRVDVNKSLCAKLRDQVCVNLNHFQLKHLYSKVYNEFQNTNSAMVGDYISKTPTRNFLNREKKFEDAVDANRFNETLNMSVPNEQWVYSTPPKQRLVVPHTQPRNTVFCQPVVMCTDAERDCRVFYEYRKEKDFDPRNVVVDETRLRKIDEIRNTPARRCDGGDSMFDDDRFMEKKQLQDDMGYVEHNEEEDIFNVFSRPAKKTSSSFLKCSRVTPNRVRLSFEDQENNRNNIIDKDYTLIEENGTYEMQPSQNAKRRKVVMSTHREAPSTFTFQDMFGIAGSSADYNERFFDFGSME